MTIKLVLPSYLTAYLLSIVLGLLAGSHKNKWQDKLIDGFCSVGISMPTFWFVMIVMYFLGYKFKIFPLMGMRTIGLEDSFTDFMKHFIMPYIVLTGAVITETIFSWPGIGSYFVKAISAMDYPIVMSILVLSGTLVILGNLLSDVLYCLTDPRIKSMK